MHATTFRQKVNEADWDLEMDILKTRVELRQSSSLDSNMSIVGGYVHRTYKTKEQK
jgi:hypothetical protein